MKDENILILTGFLDIFSVSILVTSLPLYLKSFNVSTTYIGIFFSLYGALQIVSSYLMGYIADKFGKKLIICFCALATSVGYIALGLAPSFISICLFRIITGLFKQTQTLSRTILATKPMSNNNERVVILGRFSTFSTVGFIFGPPISGYIYQNFNFFYISCISSFGFLLIFILLLKVDLQPISHSQANEYNSIPNLKSTNVRRRKKSKEEIQRASLSNEDDDKISLIIKKTWDIQLPIFIMSFCPLLFRVNYSLALKEIFESTSTLSGFASSYGAITGSISGLVVPFVMKQYNDYYMSNMKNQSNEIAESKLLLHISIVLAMSYLGCSLAPSLTLFILFQSPISFVNGLSREAFNVIIAKRVPQKHVGRVMGMAGSLVSFGRLVAPTVGGIMQETSYRLPIFSSCICSFFASVIIHNFS